MFNYFWQVSLQPTVIWLHPVRKLNIAGHHIIMGPVWIQIRQDLPSAATYIQKCGCITALIYHTYTAYSRTPVDVPKLIKTPSDPVSTSRWSCCSDQAGRQTDSGKVCNSTWTLGSAGVPLAAIPLTAGSTHYWPILNSWRYMDVSSQLHAPANSPLRTALGTNPVLRWAGLRADTDTAVTRTKWRHGHSSDENRVPTRTQQWREPSADTDTAVTRTEWRHGHSSDENRVTTRTQQWREPSDDMDTAVTRTEWRQSRPQALSLHWRTLWMKVDRKWKNAKVWIKLM
jgi:hypothetical protein